MFRIPSEKALLESFRLVDRDEVVLPKDIRFPLGIKDYYAWVEPSGYRVYLVFNDRGTGLPLGIVFRRDQTSSGAAAQMCEWCHSVRAGDGVTLLGATASSNRRVGIQLCRDLSCKDKVSSIPGVNDIPDTSDPRSRVQKIIQRMAAFARRELF